MDTHHDLQKLRIRLTEVLASITTYNPPVVRAPIIDASVDNSDGAPRHDSVRGLRKLKESVKRDLEILEKFLASPKNATTPALSTNAPYLIEVWNEVIHAKCPVVAIWDTYSETGTPLHPRKRNAPKEAGVKVDVVADGGKQWIRVNTTKNSRMLAEFREIDSYLTDSESDEDIDGAHHTPSLAQTQFDNSLLRMGRSLLAAARANPLPGNMGIPNVTLRLTRLDPSPVNKDEHDPRIAHTIQGLREMGVDVQLGERSSSETVQGDHSTVRIAPQWLPTTHINLDLSILIAMVSDLTHAPLPLSVQEAELRFTPGPQYLQWKKKRAASSIQPATDDQAGDVADARPSRALVQQAVQEMGHALFEDIFHRIATPPNPDSDSETGSTRQPVQFWTTHEARERCLQIVGKIGGPGEKRRAEVLLCLDPTDLRLAEKEFWRDSRYPTGYIPLLPVRLLPSSEPGENLEPPPRSPSGLPLSPFFHSLARTCRDILAQETVPRPRMGSPPIEHSPDGEDELGEIERATVMKANPRLTVHTVQTMLWGAVNGWTTLTANKTSVKALLRDVKATRNGALWDRVGDNDQPKSTDGEAQSEVAAIWMVDPRSLAEGMRADFDSS